MDLKYFWTDIFFDQMPSIYQAYLSHKKNHKKVFQTDTQTDRWKDGKAEEAIYTVLKNLISVLPTMAFIVLGTGGGGPTFNAFSEREESRCGGISTGCFPSSIVKGVGVRGGGGAAI